MQALDPICIDLHVEKQVNHLRSRHSVAPVSRADALGFQSLKAPLGGERLFASGLSVLLPYASGLLFSVPAKTPLRLTAAPVGSVPPRTYLCCPANDKPRSLLRGAVVAREVRARQWPSVACQV